MKFLAELKRRNVIRMAGLYIVAAWLIVQVAETLLPIFDTPNWVLQALVLLLALGFIPALIVAWIFELTPEGLRREQSVDPDSPGIDRTARRLDFTVIVLLLAIAGMQAGLYFTRSEPAPELVSADSMPPGGGVEVADAGAKTTVAAQGLAVLPFQNLSEDSANAYFAGGIHDDVLNQLSRIDALRVISRTSMLSIAKHGLEIPEMAKRLGVSHVLEGSVRRDAQRVRVSVQLIEASADRQIWAETYDHDLDDVFAIQSKVALAIVEQMRIRLSPGIADRVARPPTLSRKAYERFMQARMASEATWTPAEYQTVIDGYQEAVTLDPDFVEAQVQLARAHGRMYWMSADPEGRHAAAAQALTALIQQRWPDGEDSLLAQANVLYLVDCDYERALLAFRELERANPGSADAVRGISASLKRLARHAEHLVAARRWMEMEPESPSAWYDLALAYEGLGQAEQALETAASARARFPWDRWSRFLHVEKRLRFRGDLDVVIEWGDSDVEALGELVADARFAKGDAEGALAALEPRGAYSLDDAFAEARRVELLRAMGRDRDAQDAAQRGLEYRFGPGEAELRTLPIRRRAMAYADTAAVAAAAGDRSRALHWRDQSLATPQPEVFLMGNVAERLALADSLLGDHDSAWARMQPHLDRGDYTGKAITALRPLYDLRYGRSAAYRDHVATLQASQGG